MTALPLGPLGTLLLLLWRALRITVGTKNTALARQRLQYCAAILAIVKMNAGIHRHNLGRLIAAVRAGDGRSGDHSRFMLCANLKA